jgi:hypothetical protein
MGGVVSWTVMFTVSGAELTFPSFTTKVIVVVPKGNVTVGLTSVADPPGQVHE